MPGRSQDLKQYLLRYLVRVSPKKGASPEEVLSEVQKYAYPDVEEEECPYFFGPSSLRFCNAVILEYLEGLKEGAQEKPGPEQQSALDKEIQQELFGPDEKENPQKKENLLPISPDQPLPPLQSGDSDILRVPVQSTPCLLREGGVCHL